MMVIIEMEDSYNLDPKVVDYIKSKGIDVSHSPLTTWVGPNGPYDIYKHVWMECDSPYDVERLYEIFDGHATYTRYADCVLFEIDEDWDE